MKNLIFAILDIAILLQMIYYIICIVSGDIKFIFWLVINFLLFIVCTLSLIEEFKKSKSNEKSN